MNMLDILKRSMIIISTFLLLLQPIDEAHAAETLNQYLRSDNVNAKSSEYYLKIITPYRNAPRIEVVYLHSNDWCGTSGCTLLIIANEGGKRKEVGGFTTQLPVWLLGHSKSGYPVFNVRHYGGGSFKVYCGMLRFDGHKYVEDTPRRAKGRCPEGSPLIERK